MAEKRDEQTVKDFAGYIVKRAKEITHYNQKLNERVNKAVVYSVGTGSLLATIPFFGNPLYHLSGLAASAVGSAVDKYSTMIAARQMDKKFHEYGFGRHYWETGKMMPKHPTEEYYTKPSAKALARTLGIVSLGAFVPSVGYAQIAQAPVVYKNNISIGKEIKISKDMGDMVQKMIYEGYSRDEIRQAIRGYGATAKEKQSRRRLEERVLSSFFIVLAIMLIFLSANFSITGGFIFEDGIVKNLFFIYPVSLFILMLIFILLKSKKETLEESIDNEKIQEEGRNLISYFIKKSGIKGISEEDYPIFVVKGGAHEATYEGKTNAMEIGSPEILEKGGKIGEEIGHFLREKLRPDHEEILTDEFFGWLGARALSEYTKKNGASKYPAFHAPKSFAVKRLKGIRREFKELEELYGKQKSKAKREEIEEEVRNIGDERYDILTHQRGYDFASRIDLSKIHNIKKLYSMPDKEVRKRFFRKNPDYSGI